MTGCTIHCYLISIVYAIVIMVMQIFDNQYPRCPANARMVKSLLIDTIKTILLHIIIRNTLIKHNNPAI